jgi:photosynthetic reaction center cytochrome c subunit
MASDEVYTKVVARRMLEMTRAINGEWSDHVKQTGVTCYTCHRGNPVPQNVWSKDASMTGVTSIRNNKHGQNDPVASVGYSTLPKDPFTPYLLGAEPIRVQGNDSLATGHVASIQHTEKTYGLMMHMSQGLGVNCNYCHNSRQWQSWAQSTPQRVTAWYGIRMARALNTDYIEPLKPVFPANRLGPLGDPLKVNCATCHQGVNKPLLGVSMLPDHPALAGRPAQAAMLPDPAAEAAPADATTPAAAPGAAPGAEPAVSPAAPAGGATAPASGGAPAPAAKPRPT